MVPALVSAPPPVRTATLPPPAIVPAAALSITNWKPLDTTIAASPELAIRPLLAIVSGAKSACTAIPPTSMVPVLVSVLAPLLFATMPIAARPPAN